MSALKIQDHNTIVSQVFAVAQGPDGKPALLAADKPAGTVDEEFFYNVNGKVEKIEFYAQFDPITQTPSGLIATKNIVWNTTGNGNGQPARVYWT